MLRCLPFSWLVVCFFTVTLVAGAVTPVVTTTAATQVTDADASLNGTIDPMGATFEVRAEYGLTTSYGYITQGSSSFFGTGVKTCGFHPSGLATNTTYHFRITATDGTNTYVGNDMTFTTLADPPVLGAALAGVSSLAATEVNFSLYSIQSGSSQVTVSYEYGLTASYGSVVTSPTQVDKDLISYTTCFAKATGLAPGTTYHFRAKAVNAQGTVYSADNTFTTPLGPVLVTGAATGVTDLAATMNGTVMTDGLLLNVSFDIGFTTDYGGSFSVANAVSSTSAMPVSFRPPLLPPATTFHYRLKASYYYDSSIVFYGPDQTFTTLTARTTPTVAPVSVLGVGVTKVVVDCPQVVAGSSATTVVYQYGPTTAYGSSATFQTVIPPNWGSDVLMMLSGLTANTTYHLRCVATNAQGTAASEDVVFTTLPMPAIATGAATRVGDMSAVINGSLSISGVTFPVGVGFEFGTTAAYGTSVTPSPTSITGTGTFSAAVPGLLPGTTYHYRSLVVYDDTYYGPDMTFTTAAAQTPPSVGTVNNYQVSVTAVTLTAYPISAGSSTATVFWEYQAAGGPVQTASSTTQPNALALGTTGNYNEITLTNLQPGTTYTYRCGATNGQGTAYSAADTFTTLPAPTVTTNAATSVGDITAVLNGSAWAKDNSYYHLYFDVGRTTSYGMLVYPSPGDVSANTDPTSVTATDSQLLPNTTYHYRLRASCYLSGSRTLDPPSDFYGADQSFTTGPPATAPTATTVAATGIATTAATLSSIVAAGSSPATLVFEYGTTTAYGSQYVYPSTLDTSTQTAPFYLLQGLTPNTTYHYRVTATNHEGTSTGPDVSFTTLLPPTVTTMPATYISATRATLCGTSDGKGGSYTVAFDYGLTTAYGQTATATPTLGRLTVGTGGGGIIITAPPNAPSPAGSNLSGNVVSGGIIIIGGGGGGGLGGGGGTILPGTGYYEGYDATLLPQTAYHFRLKLTDVQGNSYYGADATFTTLSPVQAWRMGVFYTPNNTGLAADTACPAGDGIPNLLKYALNMAPATPGTLPQPQLKDYSGASHLSLTFQRDPSKTDLTYEVQAADSPAGPWTTLASSVGGAATTGPGFVGETYHGGGAFHNWKFWSYWQYNCWNCWHYSPANWLPHTCFGPHGCRSERHRQHARCAIPFHAATCHTLSFMRSDRATGRCCTLMDGRAAATPIVL